MTRRNVLPLYLNRDRVGAESSNTPLGGTGSGKIHCCAGIGYGLIEAGYSVFFVRTSDLVQRMQAARKDLSLQQMLTRLDRIDVLILDDIGYARKISQRRACSSNSLPSSN